MAIGPTGSCGETFHTKLDQLQKQVAQDQWSWNPLTWVGLASPPDPSRKLTSEVRTLLERNLTHLSPEDLPALEYLRKTLFSSVEGVEFWHKYQISEIADSVGEEHNKLVLHTALERMRLTDEEIAELEGKSPFEQASFCLGIPQYRFRLLDELGNFRLRNDQERLEIAKGYLVGESDEERRYLSACDIIHRFENLGIESEASRLELAKELLLIAPDNISYVQNFEIVSPEGKEELRQFCLDKITQLAPYSLLSSWDLIGIEDEGLKRELILKLATRSPWLISENYLDFEISDPEFDEQVATICAEGGTDWLSEVDNFALSEERLWKLVEKSLEEGTASPEFRPEEDFILKLKRISDPEQKLRLIKKLAVFSGRNVANVFEHIAPSSLEPGERFAIAKACMTSVDKPNELNQFNLSEEQVIELVRLAALSPEGDSIATRIYSWPLPEEVKKEVTLTCLIHTPYKTLSDLSNKSRRDPNFVTPELKREILEAIRSNVNDPEVARTLTKHFPFFDVEDATERYELAKICAQKSPQAFIERVDHFALPFEQQLELLWIAGEKERFAMTFLQRDKLKEATPILEELKLLHSEPEERSAVPEGKAAFRKISEDIEALPRNTEYEERVWQERDQWFKTTKTMIALKAGVSGGTSIDSESPEFKWMVSRLADAVTVRDKDERHLLTSAIISAAYRKPSIDEKWSDLSQGLAKRERSTHRLLRVVACELMASGVDETSILSFLELCKPQNTTESKDLKAAIGCALTLLYASDLTPDEKNAILSKILPKREAEQAPTQTTETAKEERERRMAKKRAEKQAMAERGKTGAPVAKTVSPTRHLLTNAAKAVSIIEMGEGKELAKEVNAPLNDTLAHAFQKHVHMPNVENLGEKFAASFGAGRTPSAVVTYASRVYSVESSETKLVDTFHRYVRSVLEGEFKEERYKLEQNEHLQTVASWERTDGGNSSLPKNGKELLEAWKQGETVSKTALLAGQSGSSKVAVGSWLEKIFKSNPSLKERCSYASTALKDPEQYEAVKKELGERAKEANISLGKAKRENREDQGALEQNSKALHFQTCMLQLLKPGDALEAEVVKLKAAAKSANAQGLTTLAEAITERLSTMEEEAKAQSKVTSSLVVVDSNDPIDFLLVGSDPGGSCQAVTGNIRENRALMGYAMDGRTRVLALKAGEGPESKIMARAMFRLLWDGEKPVLFIEPVYPEVATEENKRALELLALRRAEAMGLELYQSGKKKTADTEELSHPLLSLSSPTPYDYSDSANPTGVKPNGIYEIHQAQRVTVS